MIRISYGKGRRSNNGFWWEGRGLFGYCLLGRPGKWMSKRAIMRRLAKMTFGLEDFIIIPHRCVGYAPLLVTVEGRK